MTLRSRSGLVLALAALVVFTSTGPAGGQEIEFGGGGDGGGNEKQNDDGGGRRNRNRNRNRDNDNQNNNGIQLGGSDAQQIQQAVQGLQGNSNQQDFGQPGQSQPFKKGKQFKNSQKWQNWQQNGQGNWKKKHKHNDWEHWAIQFGGPAPFSAQWYSHHPHAWHHHHHDDDAWKVATAAGVLSWLGWQAHPYDHTTVIYEPVPVETIYVQGQPPVVDPTTPGEWMTLGVYSLMTGPGDTGTRMLELAVDKHGHVRGNFYDTILNASHTVTGRMDQRTQHVQWSIDANKQLTFFAHLSQLTQGQGVVNVKFPSGQQEQWQITRMETAGNN
jgi:hypothetical protein